MHARKTGEPVSTEYDKERPHCILPVANTYGNGQKRFGFFCLMDKTSQKIRRPGLKEKKPGSTPYVVPRELMKTSLRRGRWAWI